MRRLVLTPTLFLAACATTPQPAPAPQPPAPQPQPQPPEQGSLIGLSAQELVGRFGNPALQVREGTSLKLQFRGTRCVLDAYLYPSASGPRVTHVDTRLPSGGDIDQAACISALRNRSI
jgi:hypothetical protein